VVAAVALLASAAALQGCSAGTGSTGSSAAAAKSIVLERPAGETNDTKVYDAVFKACEASTGITIKTQGIPQDGYTAKVLQQISSKTLPDVLMLDNGDVPSIAESGALAPLKDHGVSATGYADGVVKASSYKGDLYGIQPVANTIALFVNPKLLAAAGVQAPTTWAELKTAAAKLTKGSTYGIAFSAPATEEGTFQFLPFFWSNDADESDIATPKAAAALQLWVDLVKDKSASQSVVTWTQADVNDQFIAGKAAMMINGPWQIPSLDDAKAPYEIDAIPAPSAGTQIVSPLGGETWTLPNTKDKAKMAAAAKVLSCIGSDKSQLALAEGRNLVPTKTALTAEFLKVAPKMKGFAEQVPGLRARTAELGPDYAKASTKIWTAIQTALTSNTAPLAALQQAAKG
jgi:multiple sugar transport system substrate-binding protein